MRDFVVYSLSSPFTFNISYVMQNFYNINPLLTLNHRLRVTWLLRNIYLIVILIFKTYNTFLFNVKFKTNHDLLYRLNLLFFARSFMSTLQTTQKKWKTFITLSLTKSIKHHIYLNGLTFIDTKVMKPINSSIRFSKNELLFNQYYLPFSISNISLHNKPFRNVLFRTLLLLLTNWQHWNKHFSISFGFLLGSSDLYMLYFYNMYIFKVYNL